MSRRVAALIIVLIGASLAGCGSDEDATMEPEPTAVEPSAEPTVALTPVATTEPLPSP